jgi:hypothetical protein
MIRASTPLFRRKTTVVIVGGSTVAAAIGIAAAVSGGFGRLVTSITEDSVAQAGPKVLRSFAARRILEGNFSNTPLFKR